MLESLSNKVADLLVQELEGGYAQKLREEFSYSFFGHIFSVDSKNQGYMSKFWAKM